MYYMTKNNKIALSLASIEKNWLITWQLMHRYILVNNNNLPLI